MSHSSDKELESKEEKEQIIKQFCNICCGERSKFITCLFCKHTACNSCNESYILTQLQPRCMSCNKEWNYEFLQNNFTNAFINKKYKEYRKGILFELEKAMLPHTQRNIARDNEAKKIEQDIVMYKNIIAQLEMKKRGLYDNVESKEEEQQETVLKNCPVNDCRGFLTSKYTCGLCEVKVCSKCLEVKDVGIHDQAALTKSEEHKCNPDTLNTIELLKRDSKNCPKCNAFVHKTQGCDVMWCTNCKTPFSWKTCKIITTGNVHNPHYFEYLASIGEDTRQVARMFGGNNRIRNIAAVDENNVYCVNFRDFPWLMSNFRFVDKYHDLLEYLRLIMHTEDVDFRRYNPGNLETDNEDIRRKYLNKEIDDKQFQSLIYRRQKRFDFDNEVYMLLQMFVNLCKEEWCKLFLHIKSLLNLNKRTYLLSKDPVFVQFLYKLKNLQIYCKTNLMSICKRFDYKVPSNIDMLENVWMERLEKIPSYNN
jgi:hypothetical protein